MQKYIGQKLIQAKPMTRQEYNDYRGWELPADENGADEGYLVEYMDGGQANHPDHEGYISWSPKAVFDNTYRAIDGLTFGMAIEALKRGEKVARSGWNGNGMWLKLIERPNENVIDLVSMEQKTMELLPFLVMKTADEKFVPWLASQTDVLAEDWQIIAI